MQKQTYTYLNERKLYFLKHTSLNTEDDDDDDTTTTAATTIRWICEESRNVNNQFHTAVDKSTSKI
jgi:hypothetical protein